MPRTKAAGSLAGLVESDSEPDFDAFEAPSRKPNRTAAQPAVVAKKPRGRPPANKVVKPAQKQGWRVGSAVSPEAASRQALKERSTNPPQTSRSETKSTASVTKKAVGRPPLSKRSAAKGPGAAGAAPVKESEAAATDIPISKRRRRDTDEDSQDADLVETMDIDDELDEPRVPAERSPSPESPLVENMEDLLPHDSDDTSLRTRYDELARRYESLESRHKELREIGVKEAERNVERIKMQGEENKKIAGKLISELKAELAAKSSVEKQSEGLQHQLDLSEEKCDGLQSKVAELTASLSKARAEAKTLNTKLAAARTEIGTTAPGSALKPTGANARGVQSEYLHTVLAKEDLYGDLTGLIVRGVKNVESETEFDCIQTGRNGTLHFKLALDKTDSSEQYEDVQYAYRPQLHNDRDVDLLDILPDFLQEDITFPRTHASKFYSRVVKSLTDRVE